jgi:hypothetical protein
LSSPKYAPPSASTRPAESGETRQGAPATEQHRASDFDSATGAARLICATNFSAVA